MLDAIKFKLFTENIVMMNIHYREYCEYCKVQTFTENIMMVSWLVTQISVVSPTGQIW